MDLCEGCQQRTHESNCETKQTSVTKQAGTRREGEDEARWEKEGKEGWWLVRFRPIIYTTGGGGWRRRDGELNGSLNSNGVSLTVRNVAARTSRSLGGWSQRKSSTSTPDQWQELPVIVQYVVCVSSSWGVAVVQCNIQECNTITDRSRTTHRFSCI